MSSNLNHINGAVASGFLWNRSFWSKCWVHCSFTAETVKSLFPTFLESASSTHSHGLFLWGCNFAERLSVCRRDRAREREPLSWCRPVLLGPAIVNSSSPATLSLSLSMCIYIFLIEQLFQHFASCWCGWWCLPSLVQFLMSPPFLLTEVLSLTSYCSYPIP